MKPLYLEIANQSTVLTDAQIAVMVAAIQMQAGTDYAKAWGWPPSRSYKLLFVDSDPNVSGALGYHDLERDVPVAHILCKTTLDAGVSISSVLSHEVLEILGDANTTSVVMHDTSANQDGTKFTLYMAELCDAVEQSSYQINGVEVSNFVLPAWFDPQNKVGPYDFLRKLTRPLALLPGGSYMGLLYGGSTHGWQSKQAEQSRRESS